MELHALPIYHSPMAQCGGHKSITTASIVNTRYIINDNSYARVWYHPCFSVF